MSQVYGYQWEGMVSVKRRDVGGDCMWEGKRSVLDNGSGKWNNQMEKKWTWSC